MAVGFKDKDKKFHPINNTKGVRMKKDKSIKPTGTKFRKRHDHQGQLIILLDMSEKDRMEWEDVVGSDIVKVKHEMMDGKPITSVRFANGEEWFEFDHIDHQETFMKDNKIMVNENIKGEFVEIDHPMISGYITMDSGKVLFGERETRMKRDAMLEEPITFYEDPSHGYYRVPTSLLKKLGIEDKITPYSKQEGDIVYLEEDADATLFFKTLEKKGIEVPKDKIMEKYFQNSNENPASIDFGLCAECGTSFSSGEKLREHEESHHGN